MCSPIRPLPHIYLFLTLHTLTVPQKHTHTNCAPSLSARAANALHAAATGPPFMHIPLATSNSDTNCYCSMLPDAFQVRTADYAKTGVKFASGPACFGIVAVVGFKADPLIPSLVDALIASNAPVPPALEHLLPTGSPPPSPFDNPLIPQTLIVHWHLPFTHSYTGSTTGGGQLAFVFSPTPAFASAVNSNTMTDPQRNTLHWLLNAPGDATVSGRFKAIMRLRNLEEMNLNR